MAYVDDRKAEIAREDSLVGFARRKRGALHDLVFIAERLEVLGLTNFASAIRDAVTHLRRGV